MARLPRIVVPGYPHHVTQRGNRRGRTFFEDGDYALYKELPGDEAGYRRLRQSETTGRPIGDENWMRQLEATTGKPLLPRKRGPKKKIELCI